MKRAYGFEVELGWVGKGSALGASGLGVGSGNGPFFKGRFVFPKASRRVFPRGALENYMG